MQKIDPVKLHIADPGHCAECGHHYRGHELPFLVSEPYRSYSDPSTGELAGFQGQNSYRVCSRDCAERLEYNLDWTGPLEG